MQGRRSRYRLANANAQRWRRSRSFRATSRKQVLMGLPIGLVITGRDCRLDRGSTVKRQLAPGPGPVPGW